MLCFDAMRTTVTLDDDLAIRLDQRRSRHGESFKQALNEAVRAGLNQLENSAEVPREIRRTKPLALGRRLAGSTDDVGEVLAIAEGEDYR
jgi:plasmid stability protein